MLNLIIEFKGLLAFELVVKKQSGLIFKNFVLLIETTVPERVIIGWVHP